MNVTERVRPIELIRPYGQLRGIGRIESRADGGAPPRPQAGVISAIQAHMASRGHASATESNPGAQATAATPPNPARIDVKV